MRLDWHKSTAVWGRAAWTADGVYADQWYAVTRNHEKWWVATFHDHDGREPFTDQLGCGTFGAMKKLCREHADRVKEWG